MGTKGALGVSGLKTSGNELTYQPGSLTQADNVVFPSKGVAISRRGEYPSTYIDNDSNDANSNRPREIWQWGHHLFISMKSAANAYTLALWEAFDSSPSYHSLGTQTPPEPNVMRMKFAELSKSAYWTTSTGLHTIDTPAGSARSAGIPAPLAFLQDRAAGAGPLTTGLNGNPNATGSWLPKNTAVAARVVIGLKDANEVVRLSKPNGRAVVVNPNDVLVPTGSLVITSNVVTATVTSHNFSVGDYLNLSDSDGGVYTTTNNLVTAITATTIVWAQTHANHASGVDITLTSGKKSVTWNCLLPAGLTAGRHFVQLYRTDPSSGDTIDPGDECFLCFERYITATDISNHYVIIQDSGPSQPPGGPLAINENTGDGIAAGSNERPPLCRDICVWDGRIWGAHTTDSHRLPMRLLGIGSPNGLQANDVVCLNSEAVVLTSVITVFGPTANVLVTLNVLAFAYSVATSYTGSFFRVLMSGGDDGTFGEFMLEENGVGGSALYAATNRTTAFADKLATAISVTAGSTSRLTGVVTVTTGSAHGFVSGDSIMLARNRVHDDANFPKGIKTPITVTGATTFTYAEAGADITMDAAATFYVYALTFKSDNGKQPLRFSKRFEPEAWPLVNFPGGLPDGADVLRIRPTTDASELLVLINSGDTYAISGQYPYYVRRVTGSASLVAADSLVEHANQLYGLTTQGVCTLGGYGISLFNRDVEDDFRALLANIQTSPNVAQYVFGVSYESDHQYQLWIPTDWADAYAKKAYLYHSTGDGWANFAGNRSCGLVFKGWDQLILGEATSNRLLFERKVLGSAFYTSFADGTTTLTVDGDQPSVSNIAVLSSAGVTVGDVVFIDGTYYRVTFVSAGHVAIDGDVSVVDTQPLTAYASIPVAMSFSMEATGIPGVEKHFREIQLHFGTRHFETLTVSFSNEHTASLSTVTVSPGDFVFANPITHLSTLRVSVPTAMHRSALLKVKISTSEALSYFTLLGYSATSEPVSERTGK